MHFITRLRARISNNLIWKSFAFGLLILMAVSWLAGSQQSRDQFQSPPEPTANLAVLAMPAATPPAIATEVALTPSAAVAAPVQPLLPTATPTPQPAPTPTTGSTPTPSLAPDERLAAGIQFQRYGDTQAARTQLLPLLAPEAADAALRVQAHLHLIQTYLVDGFYAEALTALDELDGLLAGDAAGIEALEQLRAKAQFLRAETWEGLGRHAEAIEAYDAFLTAFPAMDETIQPKIAQMRLLLGDVEGAAAAYRRAVDAAAAAGANTAGQLRLLEALAQSYNNAARFADAVAAYDEILSVAQNGGYRAEMQYLAGQSLASAGDEAGAIERWRAATVEAPASEAAYNALVELVNRQVDFDLYQRGYIDLKAEAWFPAIDAFQAYLDSVDPADARIGLALHGLGQAQSGAANYAAAIATLARVIAEHPTCECFGQAWLDQAAAHAALGDSAGARRIYRTFAREHAVDPLAPDALWFSGLLALREANLLEATADFLALADGFPTSARAATALYLLGLGAYQNGLSSQTVELYTRLQRDFPDYNQFAVTYWLGRAHQALGDLEQTHNQWRTLIEQAPDSYYGVLAAQSLRQPTLEQGSFLNEIAYVAETPTRLADDDGSQAYAQQWLAGWLQLDANGLAVLPAQLSTDPDLVHGTLLLEMDQRGDALPLLERVYQRYQDDAQALYALSLEFERLGVYRLSLLAMARLLESSPAKLVEDAPIFLQQRAYPRRFADLVVPEAQANGLDPLLLFSLIRQESLFEEGARSIAAAQGLAQIIPATGEWVAQRLAYPGYSNALIYRPNINVKFGAYYLSWARSYLDGNLVSALVGYNAGPGNSDAWRLVAGADDPLFVEILTVSEPRVYVQMITSNLYHYTRLYGPS